VGSKGQAGVLDDLFVRASLHEERESHHAFGAPDRRGAFTPSGLTPGSHMYKKRCGWVGDDPLIIAYHDTEWGVPVHNDRKLFEFMVLDAMQAGLNWRIVLQKRHDFKRELDGFDPRRVARYGDRDMARLLEAPGIIHNRQKLTAAIANARAVLAVQKDFGSLDSYLWQFVNGETMTNGWTKEGQIPVTSPESEAMSRDLTKRGFKFVGPTICYAFMQAAGLVNDHLASCFRYEELANKE
jgi:DNA-3-methyladenine glycosylase I